MSAELTSGARERADRLLEPRARRGAVRCADDLASGRGRPAARRSACSPASSRSPPAGHGSAPWSPASPLLASAESARNLLWVSLLYSLSAAGEERQHGAEAGLRRGRRRCIGLQLIGDILQLVSPERARSRRPASFLRITTAAGALVLVHNVYGQAAPASRSNIRFAMLGLALDLDLRPQPLHRRLSRLAQRAGG